MNRIDRTFKELKAKGRKALIGYVTSGFPSKNSLEKLVPLLAKAGLDLIEVGIPFSDPIADGPVIQHASFQALAHGTTLSGTLRTIAGLRRRGLEAPLILMSYTNPIYRMGIAAFFRAAAASGVDGLILPDVIPEEAASFEAAARRHRVALIYLVSPTTPHRRIRSIARASRGFLYAVSLTGVTGARTELPAGLPDFLDQVRRVSPGPVAVGFGISTPAQARTAARHADGVIVGSALIKEIEKSKSGGFAGAARYVRSLRSALNSTKEGTHAS